MIFLFVIFYYFIILFFYYFIFYYFTFYNYNIAGLTYILIFFADVFIIVVSNYVDITAYFSYISISSIYHIFFDHF